MLRAFARWWILILALSITSTSLAGDGNWWVGLKRQEKIYYAAGMCDGLIMAGRAKEFGWFNHPNLDQLIDGLDKFYLDFRNRDIEVPFATEPVVMAIEGRPNQKIMERIEAYRQITASVKGR